MSSAKDIRIAPISSHDAAAAIRRLHYSGSTAANSQLHFGVFLADRLEGAMQFGPSLDKRRMLGIVPGTPWNGFLELNRMAFSDRLPRNSESRAIGFALRLIRKRYPHIQWIVSYADGTQCGDGAIYRASGFVLTAIKKNSTIWISPSGEIATNLSLKLAAKGRHSKGAASMRPFIERGWKPMPGFQLRYVNFLHPEARQRLAAPILPFSKIEEMGAGMYRGAPRGKDQEAGVHPALGGETPTPALQIAE